MHVTQGSRNLKTAFSNSVLTIGNFDGVHLGHRQLISRVIEIAHKTKLPSVVVTFEPHPIKVLYPERPFKRIFDLDDQRTELEAMGVDHLVIEPFSREFSQLSPDRYLADWVCRPFQPKQVVVGYDFSFGANRLGSIAVLQERAPRLGFTAEVTPPFKVGDVIVSSSRIRQAVDAGDVQLAADLLGRPFYLRGLIVRGAGRGRRIGIPTANLHLQAELIPMRGVYCAWAEIRGARYKAVVNIGVNPTFTSGKHVQPLSVEAHLMDFRGDIYGETLALKFVERLRDEQKFASVEDLVKQIHQDIRSGETRLS
jgi:riboflavin kinase/FMN adenylyltransferase